MQKAVIYARFSSDMQREESIDAQVRACKYYAQKQELNVVKVYSDSAKSGRSTKKRDGFLQMITDAEAGQFDVVLVHKLNRFSRDGADTINYRNRLTAAGVELVSITERLDNTPEGKFMLYIITGMNEFYSANLATEVMKGLKENAYQCRHTGGIPPLGYDVGPDQKLTINEQEAKAVRMIFSLYEQGNGYSYIVDRLNGQGFRTKRGQPFGKNSLHDILKNEKYTGVYVFGRSSPADSRGKFNRHQYQDDYIRVENGCPLIIEKDQFERVQKMMEQNQHQSGRYKAKVVYILSGKVFCGCCGSRMVGENRRSNGTDYYYYVCNKAKRQHTCNKKVIRKEKLEEFVIQQLNHIAFSDAFKESLIDAVLKSYENGSLESERERLSNEIRQTDQEIKNLVNAVMKGLDCEEIQQAMAERKAHKESLQKELVALTGAPGARMNREELAAYFNQFLNIANMSPEGQRSVIQKYVDRIIVRDNPDGGDPLIDICLNPNQEPLSQALENCGFGGECSFSAKAIAQHLVLPDVVLFSFQKDSLKYDHKIFGVK